MFSVITELGRVKEAEAKPVAVKADDNESLLFEWLNSLIYLFDVEHFLGKRFDITEFSEQKLSATCWGEKYDPSRHQLKLGIKSATYHMLQVNREKNTVQVIFDI
jgi:SHS2 domain-containing protein